ncbi:UDP-2,3-diacylglucosamine diphosphatase [Ectothiorhodospira haloalkaliphila]|uniref:UDP-2,3-diacylglucosamine diphosphatase n=1 Tax=Ectothiorhodospira TaxID=1051 RepID=UPI001EE948F3|nr:MULTISPECIES: UDP-2,3-diacylglucosamine diphosphatase [Ectothiorhodospira]MCG5496966.1 UDP-2,3-diacylglucosamine diphosphatase [Ectothiorhodospira variabilis]MCG5525109.1 UDP-2,3-diacylglucosamine diphosphatase [Ectothiorhodospira haloalkaliphila]
MASIHCRSIFLSDVHLGTRQSRADYLLDFLESTECESLYLVGDIFDLWSMKRSVYWSTDHSAVIQCILDKAQAGTRVIYIPGNHDEALRAFVGTVFQGVSVQRQAEHVTADGRRFLVSHGDEFDTLVKHNRLAKALGDGAYKVLLRINQAYNAWRMRMGHSYWSLSGHVKTRVGKAREYIRRFEAAAAGRAAERNYDGYICGHIHKAGIERIDGVLYCNDGDWVEHCTALLEDFQGNIRLMHWSNHSREEALHRAPALTPTPLPPAGEGLKPAFLQSRASSGL